MFLLEKKKGSCTKIILGFFVFLSFAILATSQSFSQNFFDEAERNIKDFTFKVKAFEDQISKGFIGEEKLQNIQISANQLVDKITIYRENLKPKLSDIKSQIERLGPAPLKDQPSEASALIKEREGLTKNFGLYDAFDKKAVLLQTRMEQLLRDINKLRREKFTRQIFRQYEKPLSFSLFSQIRNDTQQGIDRVQKILDTVQLDKFTTWPVFVFFALILLIGIILYVISKRIVDQLRTPPKETDELAFLQRATSATFVTLARAAPPIFLSVFLYFGFSYLDLFNEPIENLAKTILYSLIIYFTISAMVKTLLAPNRAEWRLFSLSDTAANILPRLIQAITLVFCLDLIWSRVNEIIDAPLSLNTGQNFIASISFAALLIVISMIRLQTEEKMIANSSRLWPVWLKIPLWLSAIIIIVSASNGYISLAKFLASQIIITSAVLVMAFLVHVAISELSSDLKNDKTLFGTWIKNTLVQEETARHHLAVLFNVFCNLLLLFFIIPLILLQWGFSVNDMQNGLSLVFFGLDVGNFRFSMISIIIAIGLFILGLVLTRLFQGWLDGGPFELTKYQNGVGASIRAVVGYAGFILSALLAISYAGLDFTNIAIVAGALSVGIGFGLQSIVNNFVSGLILLIERPVKVGDWVIVGDQQGYVRRISVRATEVETFDRSSVIIPNSQLITSTVTNWTHGNSVGRVTVKVGVAYSSNAKNVYDLLMKIGQNHPKRLSFPEVKVVFEDFGTSSLDFCLYVFIADIRDVMNVQTELRMAIFEKFQEEKIEIPFPQRDINIKDLEA